MPSSTVDNASPAPHFGHEVPLIPGRWFALFALFSMNMLNYIDRYSFFAVGTHIQSELKISNSGFGILSASFMIVYTIVSPLMGFMGDRYSRTRLLAAGVGLWSFATVGTAFSYGFSDMFFGVPCSELARQATASSLPRSWPISSSRSTGAV